MAKIEFKELVLKNFLSFGDNPETFILNKSPITLISATNGTGKSAVLDGLTFALFGKAFRGIKKNMLINSINQKDSVVQITFSKGSNEYRIIRGQKPSIFEVYKNNEKLNECAAISDMQAHIENDILGFDSATFGRVCIMSSMNYTPFLHLSAGERRNFVETMLNLSLFSEMNRINKANISKLKDQILFKQSDISNLNTQIKEKREMLRYINQHDEDELKETKNKLQEILNDIESLNKEIFGIDERLNGFPEYDSLKRQERKLLEQMIELQNQQKVIDYAKNSAKTLKNKLDTDDNCPHCHQHISDDYKSKIAKQSAEEIETLEKDTALVLNQLASVSSEHSDINAKIARIEQDIKLLNMDKSGKVESKKYLSKEAKALFAKIESIKSKSKLNESDLESNLEILEGNLNIAKVEYDSLVNEQRISIIASDLLKDSGVKADIIKQYIPLLCAYTNQYLEKMNISMKVEIDENFNETIITRFANEFTYNNLSAGERARLDISIAMAWMSVAKIKGSVDTNLLFLDEMADNALDASGTLAMLDIVNDISNNGVHVFLVSHKTNLEEYARSVIQLEKINGFTKLVRR